MSCRKVVCWTKSSQASAIADDVRTGVTGESKIRGGIDGERIEINCVTVEKSTVNGGKGCGVHRVKVGTGVKMNSLRTNHLKLVPSREPGKYTPNIWLEIDSAMFSQLYRDLISIKGKCGVK